MNTDDYEGHTEGPWHYHFFDGVDESRSTAYTVTAQCHADKGMMIWEMVQQNLNNPLAVEGFYATFFGENKEYYDGMDSVVIEAVKDLSKNPEWTDELFKEYGLDNCYWCGDDSKTTKYLPFDEGEYAYWCKECYEDSEGEIE